MSKGEQLTGQQLRKRWGTALGQQWSIRGRAGSHRVVCGDMGDVLAGLPGNSVPMIFTDPPYGHHTNNDDLIVRWEAAMGKRPFRPKEDSRSIANDGPEANALVRDLFAAAKRILLAGSCCCCCCCGGGGPDPQFARWSLWMDDLIGFKQMVVWDKGGLGMGWQYRRCWECVLVGQKPGARAYWFGDRRTPNIIRDVKKIIPKRTDHPTPKPPQLAAWFIRLHSRPGDTVLDPFLGGGSTLVAAEELGRRCYGIEIDPRWVALTLQRASEAGMRVRRLKRAC